MLDPFPVLQLIQGFVPGGDPAAEEALQRITYLLLYGPRPFARDFYEPGHITASGIVLSPGGDDVLLVYHRKLGRWLQPGGHIEESDDSVEAAARREVLEETGVALSGPGVVAGLDVHEIPAAGGEPAHLHHDIAFLFRASTADVSSPEGLETRWCRLSEVNREVIDSALLRHLGRAMDLI